MAQSEAQGVQPELRRDPITGEWVILAAGRGERPHIPAPYKAPDQPDSECPFCQGYEARTPPEICAIREGEGVDCRGWTVRTLPNKFPILVSAAPHAGVERTMSPDRRPATGTSEVIVDTPVHDKPPWMVGSGQVAAMLRMYQQRISSLREEGRTSYVHIMRNHKAAAASSLEHPHSQLFGLPFIPPSIDVELDSFAMGFSSFASCILCELIAAEIASGTRVVALSENFVAFCPFASRLPFEIWIVPRRHELRFERSEQIDELAQVMTDVMRNLRERAGDPPLNYWIHTYPLHGESRPYHWHLEILPRMTMPGGLELGAGVWVNTTDPDVAAATLRGEQE